ncbi:MAG: hypothetical protein LBL66_08275 [Clostridiales bacterium]|jgi:hypothetical protein|nr:hypothetical protein [Clostridiales bacterium]
MPETHTLPPEKKIDYSPHSLPAPWQTAILRNYGLVKAESLARALNTDAETIHAEAERLGLKRAEADPVWLARGYITLIRQNWHILSYRQLLILLEKNEGELAFLLKEDDFLGVKLGGFKPSVPEPAYAPPTREQARATAKAARLIRAYRADGGARPFDFAADYFPFPQENVPPSAKKPLIEERFLYNYNAVYGDPFLDGAPDLYDGKLLSALSALGVNGFWAQALLYQLGEFPFAPELGARRGERLRNMNRLIRKLARYGMKLYLYFNEPRSMPAAFFEKRPELRGAEENGYYALCTSIPAVQDYLYDAMKSVAGRLPGLGGVFTITMSENLTHCYSRKGADVNIAETECPRCFKRKPWEVAAEVNNILQRALTDAGAPYSLTAYLWAWNWERESIDAGIRLLDPKIKIMAVSEDRLPIDIGGTNGEVIDYSISNPGPSPKSAASFRTATAAGHKTAAKVQINNSWECSAAPYLPVFPLIHKHLSGLSRLRVDGLMLGWTLGGFPSFNLSLAREFYFARNVDLQKWYEKVFGADAAAVAKACSLFSRGFSHFPFSIDFLYGGPQNYGPAAPLGLNETNLRATMLGFPYDDLQSWRGPFPEARFIAELETLSSLWGKGLRVLEKIPLPGAATRSLLPVAQAAGIHFSSTHIQSAFARLKRDPLQNKAALLDLIRRERANTSALLRLAAMHPSIGYEASNHYYYTQNTLLEKLLNLKTCMDELKSRYE